VAVIILPDAQEDLLSLQEYMLDKWGEMGWLKAEDEIFDKFEKVNSGIYTGAAVKELITVGIFDYQNVFTSHRKLVYRRFGANTFVYVIAGHKQDFPTLLMKRLLKKL